MVLCGGMLVVLSCKVVALGCTMVVLHYYRFVYWWYWVVSSCIVVVSCSI